MLNLYSYIFYITIFLTKNIEVIGHLLSSKNVDIICWYMTLNIGMRDYREEVDNIIDMVNNRRIIVLRDVTAKSPQWRWHRAEQKGEYWMACIHASDMVVLNTGLEPILIRKDA